MQNRRFPFRCAGAILMTLALGRPFQLVNARHMMPDLVNVPVARLIRNLALLAKNNPKSVEARFNLARAHAMAYAQRAESLQGWKGRENQGVWFGYDPKNVPFTVKPIDNNAGLKAAKAHLGGSLRSHVTTFNAQTGSLTRHAASSFSTARVGRPMTSFFTRRSKRLIEGVPVAGWRGCSNGGIRG